MLGHHNRAGQNAHFTNDLEFHLIVGETLQSAPSLTVACPDPLYQCHMMAMQYLDASPHRHHTITTPSPRQRPSKKDFYTDRVYFDLDLERQIVGEMEPVFNHSAYIAILNQFHNPFRIAIPAYSSDTQ